MEGRVRGVRLKVKSCGGDKNMTGVFWSITGILMNEINQIDQTDQDHLSVSRILLKQPKPFGLNPFI